MTLTTPIDDDRHDADPPLAPRLRDAALTRQQLLEAARFRFAHDGYSATTVRDIASDVGVNVALINRYFTSKEGLFTACISRAGEQLVQEDIGADGVDQIVSRMVELLTDAPADQHSLQLLILLRSSGDAGVDAIRRDIIRSYAERMARATGWKPTDADAESVLLRAQLAMATALGIVLLRSSTGVQPLTSVTRDDLVGPLGDMLRALLSPSASAGGPSD